MGRLLSQTLGAQRQRAWRTKRGDNQFTEDASIEASSQTDTAMALVDSPDLARPSTAMWVLQKGSFNRPSGGVRCCAWRATTRRRRAYVEPVTIMGLSLWCQ